MTPSDLKQFASACEFVRESVERLLQVAESLELPTQKTLRDAIKLLNESEADAVILLAMMEIKAQREV